MTEKPFDELLVKVRWLVADHARVEIDQVGAETRFVQDLGLDSLDLVELLLKLEEEFAVSFDDAESQRVFARGPEPMKYPWGDTPEPTPELAVVGQHYRGREYKPTTLPMASVSARLGVSPFGLKHMAGNVWQRCKDWYDPDFYSKRQAAKKNPVNAQPTHARSERGGSWVGPVSLIYSSYRRGRSPEARGRCLGFRCVGEWK